MPELTPPNDAAKGAPRRLRARRASLDQPAPRRRGCTGRAAYLVPPVPDDQVDAALLRALRTRYPDRTVTIERHEPDAITDLEPAARPDPDLEEAA